MNYITLAFDIERSGCILERDTIALGASVVDYNMNELDKLMWNCYFPNGTNFEKNAGITFGKKIKRF